MSHNGVIDNGGGSNPGVAEGIGRGGVAAPLFRQSSRSLSNVLICYFRQLGKKTIFSIEIPFSHLGKGCESIILQPMILYVYDCNSLVKII